MVDRSINRKEFYIILNRLKKKYMISMAKELGFSCLAEGAEKKVQVDLLREFGCEIVQGYYYSKPVPIDRYEEMISES